MEGLLVMLVLAILAVPLLLISALVSISGLKSRVSALEQQLGEAVLRPRHDDAFTTDAPPEPFPHQSQQSDDVNPSAPLHASQAMPDAPDPLPPVRVPPVPPVPPPLVQPSQPLANAAPWPPQVSEPPPIPAAPPPYLPDVDVVGIVKTHVKRWFTTGNVPVKVGMLVLLAGVAALLKYASDQGWLQMPIELRLLGVSLAAMGGLVFGWVKRHAKPAFALSVQGGCIGVLLLVIFAAARMYSLQPAPMAFALSVVLIAGLGVLAVLQDSRSLAVLGVLAGFLAPIWLSDGSGSHIALFSYYAVLNLAVFFVAWVKPWRVLVLLGFVFTWGIGLIWGVLQYSPAHYPSAQAFLLLFFALYVLLPVAQARQRAPKLSDALHGSVLFGTPLVAFGLQAGLLQGNAMQLAFSAVAVALVYLLLATLLRPRARYAVLWPVYAVMAVGFATLAVPLAFSAQSTAAVFALEGAGLLWLGLRQQRLLPRWAGMLLQGLAGLAYLFSFDSPATAAMPVLNGSFMTGLLLALAGWLSAWLLYRDHKREWATAMYAWGLLWWLLTCLREIQRFGAYYDSAAWWLILVSLTGALAAQAYRRIGVRGLLTSTVLPAFAAALPLMFLQLLDNQHPFAGMGALAWAVYALLGLRTLWVLRNDNGVLAPIAQLIWWMVWPALLMLFASWLAQYWRLAQGWEVAMMGLPLLVLAALSLYRPAWLAWPLGAAFTPMAKCLEVGYMTTLVMGWLITLWLAGSAAPLPWLPVLNPMELMQVAAMGLVLLWLKRRHAHLLLGTHAGVLLGVLLLLWISMVTLRGTHFWGGAPWHPEMLRLSLVQTSLTVLWSVLGVIGWIVGSRRGQRTLWLASAVLMAVVLAKLVIIDRQHLGNLLGIASFIAYGLLCTVVGWFAPAPPRPVEKEPAP